MRKSFLNKLNLKLYSTPSVLEKLDTLVSKIEHSGLCGLDFWLGFLTSWFLDIF
jgi:hypothetical protein